jgi:hypothetical protein
MTELGETLVTSRGPERATVVTMGATTTVELTDRSSTAPWLSLTLADRSIATAVRLTPTHLAVGDELGRLIVVDLEARAIERDLRIRAG